MLDEWIKLLTFISLYSASLVAAVKGLIDWISYKNSIDADGQIKSRRGKIYSILGIVCFLIISVVLIMLTRMSRDSDSENKESDQPEPETESIAPLNEDDYVENLLYSGSTYTGYIDREARVPNGKGTMEYLDGGKYYGEWENGVRQGQGTMMYSNGDKYEGAWQDGKKYGKGTYIWSDGKKYEGKYKDDMRDGDGVFIGWTGFVSAYGWKGNFYGNSKDDKFEGYGKFEFDNGDKFEGIFHEDGFWDGTYTKIDGSAYEIIDGKSVS